MRRGCNSHRGLPVHARDVTVMGSSTFAPEATRSALAPPSRSTVSQQPNHPVYFESSSCLAVRLTSPEKIEQLRSGTVVVVFLTLAFSLCFFLKLLCRSLSFYCSRLAHSLNSLARAASNVLLHVLASAPLVSGRGEGKWRPARPIISCQISSTVDAYAIVFPPWAKNSVCWRTPHVTSTTRRQNLI
ncbi:hypothetical protein EJ04DRAFT_240656 [Polyplosphaeria fusca]|uniref:Transmembrane protein n=1 Tax=Polyplosphaeria fusca TaxID=682080 RepID=A0A9P4QZZ7_9PLEO|nr:hypothetical protein EJ04DRAFT_240656 [Polyplosphaeria fusca]